MSTTNDISPDDRATWQVPAMETPLWLGKQHPYCVVIPVINEGERIKSLLNRMENNSIPSIADVIIVDGGSTDGSLELDALKQAGVRGLLLKKGQGKLSAQLRCAYAFALDQGYEGIITIDGNDKDDPEAIPRFIEALRDGIDFVQASRFLPGGVAVNTPKSRDFAIRYIHAPCLSLASGFKWTDTTQGFRAYSRRMLLDRKIAPFRDVFLTYELLAYLSYRAPKLGYLCKELPTIRTYPNGEIPTKITSIRGNLKVLFILFTASLSLFNPPRIRSDTASMTKRDKYIIFGLLAVCWLLFWTAFYPGFMSHDSINQFGMSKSLHFNDWHPPIMSWVWSIVGFFFDGPSGMLALHQTLVWMSVYIWWNSYRDRSFSWLIFAIPFLPWVLNFAGVLWKDVGLGFSLFALSGLALRTPTPLKISLASILVFYSINLRYNAIFAVFPLLILLTYRWLENPSKVKALMISLFTIALSTFSGRFFNESVLNTVKTKPANYFMVDDLSYLSIKNNESFLPGIGIDEIKECATFEIGKNKLVGRIFCLMGQPSYNKAAPLTSELKSIWLEKIFRRPIDYLQFRIAAFSYLLRKPTDSPYYFWHPGIDENSFGIKHSPNGLTLVAERFVKYAAMAASFFFKPYWWLQSSLLMLALTLIFVRTKSVTTAQALLISSSSYIVGYIPLTPLADFRYIYWSVIATTISFLILCLDWPGIRSGISKIRAIVVSSFILISCLIVSNLGKFVEINLERDLYDSLDAQKIKVDDGVTTNDLVQAKGAYQVKGSDPFLIYDLSSLNLNSRDAHWLKFEFSCLGLKAAPELQLFWWGDHQVGPLEAQSTIRGLVEGVNLVPIKSYLNSLELSRLRGIRFDLANPSACEEISFKRVEFIK